MPLYAALCVAEKTYELYTEIMEDCLRTPLELEDVKHTYVLMEKEAISSRIWYMSAANFDNMYDVVKPATPTTFAIVQPK